MLKLGASPDKIIFANPCKQSSHIKFARDNGVQTIVFDNEIELFKISKIYSDAKFVHTTIDWSFFIMSIYILSAD